LVEYKLIVTCENQISLLWYDSHVWQNCFGWPSEEWTDLNGLYFIVHFRLLKCNRLWFT